MLGKVGGQEKKETTEDDMVGRHHLLNGHEFEQALGDGDRQGSLVCCSLSGHKEWDTTEQLHNNGIMLLAVGEGGRWAVQACPLHSCSCV